MSLNLESLFDFLKSNPSEQECINYFEEKRWKGKVISPFDPKSKVYKCKNNRYKCKNTRKYFTVKTGTVFRNSNLPLQKWFLALYILSNYKKGFSSCQLAKEIKTTQKTAWFVLHRLREIFDLSKFKAMLENSVEVDETFIGGKNKNRHWNKKTPSCQGRNWKDKIPIWGGIERETKRIICQVVPNTKTKSLLPMVRENIKEGSNVYSDEWLAYKHLHRWFTHEIVIHKKKQYVNGRATTNRIENVWGHLKGTIRTYTHISRKHSQRYLDEFALRFNTREYKTEERFDLVLLASVGKSLSYSQLIS
jgi:transposase-like protein